MVLINVKGNVTYYLVGIIITVLTFFIYIGFFTNITGSVVSQSDDLYCRTLLSTKSNAIVKTGEFFIGDITQKCKKDEIKKSVKSEEEVYETVANSMQRCWYRYGEGQYDFMSSWDKEGSWCFTCAKIEVVDKSSGTGVYSYEDLIDWMSSNDIKYKNGTKVKYYDYVNLKYSPDVEYEGNIEEDIRDILDNGEGYMKSLAVLFSDQYISMQDLRSKQIRTGEDIYVIYRYDKQDNDIGESVNQAMYGAAAGAGLSIAATFGGEFLIDKAMTIAVCAGSAFTGPLAPFICGGALVKSAKNTYDTVKDVGKLANMRTKVMKIWTYLDKSVGFSRDAQKAKMLKVFTGSVDELDDIYDNLKTIDLDDADKIKKIKDTMTSLNIKHLDDIKDLKSLKDDEFKKMQEIIKESKSLNQKNVDWLSEESKADMDKEIKEINNLEKEVSDLFDKPQAEFNEIVSNDPKMTDKVKKYLRYTIIGTSTAGGAMAGANLNFHSNQYVDLMTKEQYYRLCGTEPGVLQK